MNELFVPPERRPQRTEEPRKSQRPFTGGPRPNALIIACSECTLDAPLLWSFADQPVFLLRTFGNTVADFLEAPGELIEALEEAVSWWRVPRIVVCGHSGCGGVARSSQGTTLATASCSSLFERVGQANRALAQAKSHTVEQLAALRTYPFIENAVQEYDLQFSALFYLHESGIFLRYDEAEGEYSPLM